MDGIYSLSLSIHFINTTGYMQRLDSHLHGHVSNANCT